MNQFFTLSIFAILCLNLVSGILSKFLYFKESNLKLLKLLRFCKTMFISFAQAPCFDVKNAKRKASGTMITTNIWDANKFPTNFAPNAFNVGNVLDIHFLHRTSPKVSELFFN